MEKQKPVTGDQLTSNLKGQISEFEDWQKNIKELTDKGLNENFIKEYPAIEGPAYA